MHGRLCDTYYKTEVSVAILPMFIDTNYNEEIFITVILKIPLSLPISLTFSVDSLIFHVFSELKS